MHPWLQKSLADTEPMETAEFTAFLEEVDRFRSAMHTFIQKPRLDSVPRVRLRRPTPRFHIRRGVRQRLQLYGIYNTTGWPGVVVRVGTSSEGLPIGIQVVFRPWREDVALARIHRGRAFG